MLESITGGMLMIEWCRRNRIATNIVFNFMNSEKGESFRGRFLRAREDCAHVWMEQTIQIADELGTLRKPIDPQRQKLRVDTRMRIAGFLNRKVYGTRPEDAALNGRLTLGELVEAAVRHGAQLAANAAPAMLDITPGSDAPPADSSMPSAHALAQLHAPHTEQPAPARASTATIQARVAKLTRRRTAT